MHPKSLIHIIHLDDYHSDLLVVSVVFHFGYMPVAREENKEFIGITVIESCFLYLVIIVYHVWSVLAVGYTGVMVDDAKTLRSLYHILEIDVVVVTLAPSFCRGPFCESSTLTTNCVPGILCLPLLMASRSV